MWYALEKKTSSLYFLAIVALTVVLVSFYFNQETKWYPELKTKTIEEQTLFSFGLMLFLISILSSVLSIYLLRNHNKKILETKQFIAKQKLFSQHTLSLMEACPNPLITINPEGKITHMNKAMATVTGIESLQLIGTDFVDYFIEPQKVSAIYEEVITKKSVTDAALSFYHKEGKQTNVLCNVSTYKDSAGNIAGMVVVARDITDQKRIEKELIEAKIFAELATTLVEEAKIKAENATQIAINAVKSKQQFLSNMSHEIRTPLNAIVGFTKVVLKTNLSDKQKEYLMAIKMSGDALIVLINDILDLAKADAGKITFELIPFKMAASISTILHLFEAKIHEKNLTLETYYDSRIPDILMGDPIRLHQIILNLVSNAVKFTSKGKITVCVRLVNEDHEKVSVQFSVTDTGIGINPEKMETIFDNFQQASCGTSRLYGGTGLGLAIVKQLVEPQGGSIDVISKIEEGSTFSFILPFTKTNVETEILTEIIEMDTNVKNMKILVVEDMPLNQLLMKTLLDDFGFECDITANGRLALEKLKENTYDIILMDLQMPEMNGFEATQYIRNTMNSKIPIIALTADVTTVDLAKCKTVGMDDYIAKPIDEQLLYSKLIGLVKTKTNEAVLNPIDNTDIFKYTNLKYLNDRTKSNPLLMEEIILLYLEQTPTLIRTMKKSFEDKDWNLLDASVHKMIPSFIIIGINNDFENMAKKIQEYAHNQKQTDNIYDMILTLEEVCTKACYELQEELNHLKNI